MAIRQSRGITIGKGTPQRNEGQNGDITIRSSRRGLKMYVKQANMWHGVDLGIDLKQIATTVNNLERKVKELSTKRNNFPVVDKVLLKQAGGAAAVQIKNDAGAIAFRNSADSADITLKNPKISSAASLGDDSNPVINTETSNVVKMAFNDNSADFFVRLIGQGGAYDNAIQFWSGANAKWVLGYTQNSDTIFRINAGANLDADVLQLTDAGALTVDGAVTANSVTLTGAPTKAEIDALDITEVGALDSGSITSGFGAINVGSSSINTTGTIIGGVVNGKTLNLAASTLTTSTAGTDTLLDISQTLNAGSGENSGLAIENYAMFRGTVTETDAAGWDNKYFIQMIGGSGGDEDKFTTDIDGNVVSAGTITGGTIIATSPTLTSAGSSDSSISSTQTLNDTSAAGGTQEYAQIKTDLTATDLTGWDKVYLTHQQVGGVSKFRVDSTGNVISAGTITSTGTITSSNGLSGQWCTSGNSNVSYRGGAVNTWYVGNQSMGTSITAADWLTPKFAYSMFTAHHSAQLQAWNFTTTFSSSHDYEVEMWDVEPPAAGGSYADSATGVGATQSVTAVAGKIYSIGQQSLDYTLAADHQLYLAIRYTDGSGSFYTYGTVTMEFTNA